MRHWTIELNERELRVLLAALDLAENRSPLYYRLRDHGLQSKPDAVDDALDGLVADGSLEEAS